VRSSANAFKQHQGSFTFVPIAAQQLWQTKTLDLISFLRPWLVPALSAAAAVALAVIAIRVTSAVLRRIARRQPLWLPFIGAAGGPGIAVAAFLALHAALLAAPNALYGL
jgi:hypothetical protein